MGRDKGENLVQLGCKVELEILLCVRDWMEPSARMVAEKATEAKLRWW